VGDIAVDAAYVYFTSAGTQIARVAK